MLTFDLGALDSQRVGRMGELVVELQLLAAGWQVGNFNATTMNSAGWDLFAVRAGRSLRIRVKAKRPDVSVFRWSAKPDGAIFAGFDAGAADDFVAAVSFNLDRPPETYFVPTEVVRRDLVENHAAWLAGTKRDGGMRKSTSMRHLYLDDRPELGPSHGYALKWAGYREGWDFSRHSNGL